MLCLGPAEFEAASEPLRGAVRWAWVGPYGLGTGEALGSLGEPSAVGGDGRPCGWEDREGCQLEARRAPVLTCRRPELRVQEELARGRERVPGRGSQSG